MLVNLKTATERLLRRHSKSRGRKGPQPARNRGLRCEPLEARQMLSGNYVVVDTGQTTFYDDTAVIAAPAVGDAFYGQDAQYEGHQPSYATNSAAIDPVFNATQITNVAGESDYPFYWSDTTFLHFDGSASAAVYVAFGEGLGSMDGTNVIDVHGAGCQRSDPKDGDPNDFPSWGNGPQGDVQRVFNYVRLVRDADTTSQNLPPTAEAGGPYTGQPDQTITLDASASTDADGSIVLYQWDLDADGQFDDATGATADFSATTGGTYMVGLRVTDAVHFLNEVNQFKHIRPRNGAGGVDGTIPNPMTLGYDLDDSAWL